MQFISSWNQKFKKIKKRVAKRKEREYEKITLLIFCLPRHWLSKLSLHPPAFLSVWPCLFITPISLQPVLTPLFPLLSPPHPPVSLSFFKSPSPHPLAPQVLPVPLPSLFSWTDTATRDSTLLITPKSTVHLVARQQHTGGNGKSGGWEHGMKGSAKLECC